MSHDVRDFLRGLVSLALVVGATAGLLRGLDALGARVQGDHGDFATVEALERSVGERLTLPAYFPDTFAWPPKSIRRSRGRPATVVLSFAGRDGASIRLRLFETVGGTGPFSPDVAPAAKVVSEGPVAIGEVQGLLRRVLEDDGTFWNEVAREQSGRSIALRSTGSIDELVRMAHSLHREGP